MSADRLREAAALMRSRAEAATNFQWMATAPGEVWKHYDGQVRAVGFPDDFDPSICDALDNDDAQHIASWHPAVALAVADWLDAEASAHSDADGDFWADVDPDTVANCCRMAAAIAVANAYLGQTS